MIAALQADDAIVNVASTPIAPERLAAVLDAVEQLEHALSALNEPQPDDVVDLVVTLCTRAYWAIEVAKRRDPAS